MDPTYTSLLVVFALANFLISVTGFYKCAKYKKAYEETPLLYPLGIYVWGDATVFGIFWAMAACISILLSDTVLFLLIVSLFWLVRSIGETIYWFSQQFSTVVRMQPKRYLSDKVFHGDSIWFIFQIMNQCLTVVTIITSVYLFHIWLQAH